ncbi:MAG: 30S ribosome-binding factor RbfA [Fibrobacterota bacterium]
MKHKRIDRISDLLRRETADVISKKVTDPRISGLVTVTGVDVTPDLGLARVFVNVLGESSEKKDTMKALEKAAGFIQTIVAGRIVLKRMPRFEFKYDGTLDYGEKIDSLIRTINGGDEAENG